MTLPKKPGKGKYYNPKKILTTKRDLRLTEKYLESLLSNIMLSNITLSNTTLDDEKTIEECPVCYNELNPESNYAITNCKHKFCFLCIARCITSTNKCPMCRENLDTTIQNDQSLTDSTLNSSDRQAINTLQNMTRTALERERAAREVANTVIENALEQLNERQTTRRRLIFDDL